MSALLHRAPRIVAALAMVVLLAAHVGSPDVYYAGTAGPYAIDVSIRPPQVVPGIAEVFVRVADTTATRVVVRPVFWRAGSKGAPVGDDASRVPGTPGDYTGKLWLMASGSYSVHVTVVGPRGTGTAIVPVASVATGQLALSPFLTVLLFVLGSLLVAGVITTVHLAAGESQVAPGAIVSTDVRRRGRRAAIIAVPVMALIVLGGANWWRSEAARYRRTLYRPVPTKSSVHVVDGVATLTQTVTDPTWRAGNVTPLMPDHGKMAHMFVVGVDSPFVFAHLHPALIGLTTLSIALPPLPAGRYRIFSDIVHESGFQRTLVDSFAIRAPLDSSGVRQLSDDDAWSFDQVLPVSRAMKEIRGHDGQLYMFWNGPDAVAANQPGVLRIGVTDRKGEPASIEPYLGMNGHAVVVREDGKVFIHLHPSGTSSMASEQVFAMRDRGDTTSDGRLRFDSTTMTHAAAPIQLREIRFPYAFPTAGRYRVYVQVRAQGRVHTTGFDVQVAAAR
ncbi:MAG: hypothetical protein ABIT91_25770 [Gemmatimonadaceae bacterium]